jgi:Mrp family chromosome partitioning ATPase
MATDSAGTSSPPSLSEPPGSGVRLTRLHDALKQLKAKSAASAPSSAVALAAAAPAAPPLLRETPSNVAAPESPPAAPVCLEDWLTESQLQQYRRLADNIASQLPLDGPAAIAIVGADPWHDMAGMALRLAACLTDRGQGDVLLAGHDPSAECLTKGVRQKGLVDAVAGRATWTETIAPTRMHGLSLLGPGTVASAEDAPLGEQWRSAMKELKARFRYIVTGVSPGENLVGDAWLPILDGVYLAVGLGQTPQWMVQDALARFKAAGAKLLGCIALE